MNDPQVKTSTAAIDCLLAWHETSGQKPTLEEFRLFAIKSPEVSFFVLGWQAASKRQTGILGNSRN